MDYLKRANARDKLNISVRGEELGVSLYVGERNNVECEKANDDESSAHYKYSQEIIKIAHNFYYFRLLYITL